jgi:hypothetical protein
VEVPEVIVIERRGGGSSGSLFILILGLVALRKLRAGQCA